MFYPGVDDPVINPLSNSMLHYGVPATSPNADPISTALSLGTSISSLSQPNLGLTGGTVPSVAAPGQSDTPSTEKPGFLANVTKNADGISLLLEGLTSLGNLYSAVQQNNIARDALAFKKDAYNTNLANQTQSYNTALEDRAYGRANLRGTDAAQADAAAYVAKHRLGG